MPRQNAASGPSHETYRALLASAATAATPGNNEVGRSYGPRLGSLEKQHLLQLRQ